MLAVKRRYGVTFQHGALFSSLTVAENIQLPIREYFDVSPEALASLTELRLRMVGLPVEAGAKLPSQLSGGMIKRAALARALALDPVLLFLDEPTAGLDPISAAAFDELVAYLHQGLHLTVVMITHDLDTLLAVCNRVAVLVDRKIVVDTLAGIMNNPHPWIQRIFPRPARPRGARRGASGNLMHGTRSELRSRRRVHRAGGRDGGRSSCSGTRTRGTGASTTLYEIYFTGSVSGLDRGSPVRYLGVDVGRVRRLSIDPEDASRVAVEVEIDESAPISSATRASLGLQGVTGLLFINLKEASDMDRTQPLKQGVRYPVIESVASDLDVFIESLPELMSKANELLERVSRVLSDENLAGLAETITSLRAATADLPQTSANVAKLVDQMNATVLEIHGAAQSLRGISEDARPEVRAALERLSATANNLAEASHAWTTSRAGAKFSSATSRSRDSSSSSVWCARRAPPRTSSATFRAASRRIRRRFFTSRQ